MGEEREKLDRELPDWWSNLVERLRDQGVELENLCCDDIEGSAVKVVCVASDLSESFQELRQRPRGETVMVRIDEDTRLTLDSWVETGYFKSRSEAAALFIREGLKIRGSELEDLRDSIQKVKEAKQRLRDKARKILGDQTP